MKRRKKKSKARNNFSKQGSNFSFLCFIFAQRKKNNVKCSKFPGFCIILHKKVHFLHILRYYKKIY